MWTRRVKSWARMAAPRVIALGWAVWAALTAYAYKDGAPPQLMRLEGFFHMPIWVLWATAATLLFIGALVPAPCNTKFQEVIGWSRGIGLAIMAGLLGAWTIEFFTTEASRGWVTGKNYLALAVAALTHSWWVGRHRGPTREKEKGQKWIG